MKGEGINVLFLTYHFPTPDQPGASRPWGTAKFLKELGHNVTVITAGSQYMTGKAAQERRHIWTEESINGVTVIKTFSLTNYRNSSFRRIAQYTIHICIGLLASFSRTRQQVVICSVDNLIDPILKVPLSYLMSKIKRAKLIIDYRDPYPEVAVALGYIHSQLVTKIIDKWQTWFLKRVYHIIAATPGIKRILESKGINSQQITMIPNAFHEPGLSNTRKPRQNKALSELVQKGKFIACCFGGLGQTKEIRTILETAKFVQKKKLNDIRFVFAGEGEKKNSYIKYCDKNSLRNCYFLKAQPKQELGELLQLCNVGIYSIPKYSFWNCALSNTIFDYLANSLPVIFAGKGDTAELLQKANAGMVVEPENPKALAEAIFKLYHNPELGEKMGENGRRYVLQHYSKEKLLKQFQTVLEKSGANS